MSALGSIIQGIFGIGTAGINNAAAAQREQQARAENYKYNEMSANNADARQRALINDFYTPMAQLEQMKAAGLSPSVMYGGDGSVGQTSAAQGEGASGVSPQTFGLDPMMLSQLMLNNAQREKIKAETSNIDTDTAIKEIERDIKNIDFEMYNYDYNIMSSYIENESGDPQSLYQWAKQFENFEDFSKSCVEIFGNSWETERAQATLRDIYKTSKDYDKELNEIATANFDTKFALQISQALANEDYAKLNAKAAIGYLRREIQVNELTESQNQAWNDLLNALEKKGGHYKDAAIILGVVLNSILQNTGFSVGKSKKVIEVTGGAKNETLHTLVKQ